MLYSSTSKSTLEMCAKVKPTILLKLIKPLAVICYDALQWGQVCKQIYHPPVQSGIYYTNHFM